MILKCHWVILSLSKAPRIRSRVWRFIFTRRFCPEKIMYDNILMLILVKCWNISRQNEWLKSWCEDEIALTSNDCWAQLFFFSATDEVEWSEVSGSFQCDSQTNNFIFHDKFYSAQEDLHQSTCIINNKMDQYDICCYACRTQVGFKPN